MPDTTLDLTKRQHAILVALNDDLHASTRHIAHALNTPYSTVALDIKLLERMLGVKTRRSMPDAARALGWLPYVTPKPETTPQQVRRLLAPTLPEGATKEACVLAEVVNHEAARMTQLIWLMHESEAAITTETIDAFQEAANKTGAALNKLNVELNRLRNEVLKVTA